MSILLTVAVLLALLVQKLAHVLIGKYRADDSGSMSISCLCSHYLSSVLVNVACAYAAYTIWGDSSISWLAVGFVSCLLLLTLIDLSTYLLPNVITYPLIVAGVAVNYFEIFASRESSLIGAVAGFSSFWLINALFKLVRGKEGMGGGDFKLFAAIGAWLGWQMLPLVMMLAACSGLAAALVLMCVRKEYINKIPFGPYLAAGAVLAMFYGPQISRLLIVG